MAKKMNDSSTYGRKLIQVFARLQFNKGWQSLIDLCKWLNCSKPTVMRIIRDIDRCYQGIEIEETIANRKKYYRLKRQANMNPFVQITGEELSLLQMCRAFTENLLGRQLFNEVTSALDKGGATIPDAAGAGRHFAAYLPGSIDYTPHHEIIRRLIRAMDEKRICKVAYKKPGVKRAKTFHIKPLKIFSHKETLYLDSLKAREPGEKYHAPDFHPLLAVHPFRDVEVTDRSFEFPGKYDFGETFNRNFGIIKDEEFKVVVEFTGYFADYVAERVWSPDQKITRRKNGVVELSFSASSEPEVVTWLLSFGNAARVKGPEWLVEEMKEEIGNIWKAYNI